MHTKKKFKISSFLFSLLPLPIGLAVQFIVDIIGVFVLAIYLGIQAGTQTAVDGSVGTDINSIIDSYTNIVSNSSFLTIVSAIAIGVTAIVFGIWYFKQFSKQTIIKRSEALSPKNIVLILVLGVLVQFSISMVLNLVLPLFPTTLDQYSVLMETIVGGGPVVTLIMTVVLAPIAEECMFRGIMLRSMTKIMPLTLANVLQALFFGIYHMNLVQGAYAFIIGLILGFVVLKLKSIWASILLHAVINGSGMFVDSIVPESMLSSILIVVASVIVSFVLCGLIISRFSTVNETIVEKPVMAYAYGMQPDLYQQNQWTMNMQNVQDPNLQYQQISVESLPPDPAPVIQQNDEGSDKEL